ncbi:hypothetical protein AMECASPLE_017754 [Ameca splendens]|uniref:Uncharacterized protein n=1 Tax=Ameca splendens TaxID=208324 RepID=A0ABV0XFN8_9TELE
MAAVTSAASELRLIPGFLYRSVCVRRTDERFNPELYSRVPMLCDSLKHTASAAIQDPTSSTSTRPNSQCSSNEKTEEVVIRDRWAGRQMFFTLDAGRRILIYTLGYKLTHPESVWRNDDLKM